MGGKQKKIIECLNDNNCNISKLESYKRDSNISKAISKAIKEKLGKGYSGLHCYIIEDKIATLVRLASDIKVVGCLDENAIVKILEGTANQDVAEARKALDMHNHYWGVTDEIESFLRNRLGPNYNLMKSTLNSISNIRSVLFSSYNDAKLLYIDALARAISPLV